MKRILVLVFMFVMLVSAGYASSVELDGNQFLTVNVDNTSGVYQNTVVPVTTIYPNADRILGFEVMPLSNSSENVVAIYDSASSVFMNLAEVEMIGEAECAPESFDGMWYPYPRDISNGIAIRQGPNTRVIIYFVRY